MIIAKGKTKTILPGTSQNTVLLVAEDILTGGDSAKRETIPGISTHKTTQAANVFSLLNSRSLPTAFIERTSPNTLLCYECEMYPLELVIRRYAWGTYLLRYPEYKQANGLPYRFSNPIWEMFHKWSVVSPPISTIPYQTKEEEARMEFLHTGIWQKGIYTDPYILIEDHNWSLLPSKEQVSTSKPLMTIEPIFSRYELNEVVNSIMIPTFLILEEAWQNIVTTYGPVSLVDLKIEIGKRVADNKIVIADVVDNDSWRIWPGGDPDKQLDKQCFREGHPLNQVAEKYSLVADLTDLFLER